jgi:hypothetical protein
MTQITCLDGDHATPLGVHLGIRDDSDRTAAILGLGHCPACPDTRVTAGRGGVLVCPCCWSAWWVEGDRVRCTPGAVVVEEPTARLVSARG